jgi:hypothetical protein
MALPPSYAIHFPCLAGAQVINKECRVAQSFLIKGDFCDEFSPRKRKPMRGKYTSAIALASAFLTLSAVGAAHASPAVAGDEQFKEVSLAGPGGSYTFAGQVTEVDGTQVSTTSRSSLATATSGESVLTTSVASAGEAETTWELELPSGASIELIEGEDGESSVVLLNSAGELLGTVITDSAVDALGNDVPIKFSVDGNTVTQALEPAVSDSIAYPVAVSARAGTVWYSSAWVKTISKGYVVNAVPTAAGRRQIAWSVHHIHVQHLKQVLGSQAYRVNYNIEQQFVCHVVGAYFPTGTYNMESWQPSLPWTTIANPWDRCNRIK